MQWNELTNRNKALIIAIIMVLGLVLLFFLPDSKQDSPDLDFNTQESLPTEEVEDNDLYFVEITGMINNPGVYQVSGEVLVIDLINYSGGLTDTADLEYVHNTLGLSTYLQESQKIYIPPKNSGANNDFKAINLTEKVSINNATLEQLISLPGIGEATANKIIQARPYAELDGLKEVSGIGESTYNKIVTLISL